MTYKTATEMRNKYTYVAEPVSDIILFDYFYRMVELNANGNCHWYDVVLDVADRGNEFDEDEVYTCMVAADNGDKINASIPYEQMRRVEDKFDRLGYCVNFKNGEFSITW